MSDEPLEKLAERVREATLGDAGIAARSLRAGAAGRAEARALGRTPSDGLPAEIAAFVDAVAERPVTADVEGLLARGRSEDEVFEITVSAAAAAGLVRLAQGLAALRGRS